MYRFDDKEKKESVMLVATGEYHIRPGTWRWREYQKWIDDGGVTLPYQENDSEKLPKMISDVIADMENSMHSDIEVGGISYRATETERSRISMMLSLNANLPYLEALTSDGTIKFLNRDTIISVIEAILVRDQGDLAKAAKKIEKLKDPSILVE